MTGAIFLYTYDVPNYKYILNNKQKYTEIVCDNCGAKKNRLTSGLEGKERLFCSRQCKHEFDRKTKRGTDNQWILPQDTSQCSEE